MKKIPAFTVLGQILLLSLWIVFTVYGFVFWIINGIRTGLKTKRTSNLFRLYSFTTITSVLYATVVVLLKMGFNDYDEAIAKPGLISVLILFTSLLILGSCIVSIIAMYRNRNLTTLHRYPVQILSIIQFLVTAYLVTFGVIPVITWA